MIKILTKIIKTSFLLLSILISEGCVLFPHQISPFYLYLALGVDFSLLGICLADPMVEYYREQRCPRKAG